MIDLRPRVPTGIHGLDNLIGGGFEKGKAYLVTGETGTGKTIFSIQYLLHGISIGEPGIYATMDQKPEHIIEDAASLGWDIQKHIDKEELIFIDATPQAKATSDSFNMISFFSELRTYTRVLDSRRVVLDPVVPFAAKSKGYLEIRENNRKVIRTMEENKCTTVVTTEIPPGSQSLSMLGVEELFAHGIIVLGLQRQTNRLIRTLLVRKMRGTKINLTYQTYSISPKEGIVITGPWIYE
jgi:circadian clock protein KaiC